MSVTNSVEDSASAAAMVWARVAEPEWASSLRRLVERHVEETGSAYAATLLHKWDEYLPMFWQIVPRDYAKIIGFSVPEAELERSA